MTPAQRALAVLNYEKYDQMPIVHFGYWTETLHKWADEGHLARELAQTWGDGNDTDHQLDKIFGWDFDWSRVAGGDAFLRPYFESKVVNEFDDGSQHVLNGFGVVELHRPGAGSIPAEISHTLVDRASWEEHYKWRFVWCEERVTDAYKNGGLDFYRQTDRELPLGLWCGSLYGTIRNIVGVEGGSYLQVDDPELFEEIIDTCADLCYRCVERILADGGKFDFGHFWEDICFKNGPLISPKVFDARCGKHYKRITDLLKRYGITIVSLDCDGMIDSLIPTWLRNGVNTMFPIEVGTWNASIAPWREQYGREIRGIGGMNKCVLARDRAAVDAEVERLRALVDLGGFIPCPDHRIAPDAEFDLVKYYVEKMRSTFAR
jgi:uroporphyrinogen decarboxylase